MPPPLATSHCVETRASVNSFWPRVYDKFLYVKVMKAASDEGVIISKVLTTHKHHDHAGGNTAIAGKIPGLEIVGGQKDRVQGATVTVNDGDSLSVGAITVKCLHTAG